MKFNRIFFNGWFILIVVALGACTIESNKKKGALSTVKHAEIELLQANLSKGKSKDIIQQGTSLLNKYERDSDSLGMCQAYDLIARTYYFQQEINQAIFFWKKGREVLPSSFQNLHATFASNLGSAYLFKGYQRNAISYFLEARQIFTNAKSQSDNYWINYLNIGVCYMELKDYKSAAKYFNAIPFAGNSALDVIVPLNFAKLYGLQSDKIRFNKYINLAIKNKENAPFYLPILKDVHLEFTEKLGPNIELQKVFSDYLFDYKQLNVAFDLSLWRASIKLGKPLGNLDDLQALQKSINNSDYYLLISYYRVLSDFYASKNDYKNAFIYIGLMEYCESRSEQKDANDKLYDYTLLAKRNELQQALKNEQQLNTVQEIKLRNRSIFLYFLLAIFIFLIVTSVLAFNNQRRKNKLNKNQLIIQNLELKIAKEEQNKLTNSLEYTDKKLQSILETVGKIAILKKQLGSFFSITEKTSDLGKDSKTMVKQAKLDFNLFFNNYQDLAVLSNLAVADSTKFILIKQNYPDLKDNEFRVLLLIIQNYTSKEMGLLLSCTEKNIEYYRTQIRLKLKVPKDRGLKEFIQSAFQKHP